MKQIKLKDNENRNKEDFIDIPGIIEAVSDKSLDQLEKNGIFVFPDLVNETNDLTRDQFVLKSINDNYCSSNVMGFLGCGDERLTIESRFSNGSEDFFFQYLLEKVLECPNIISMKTDASNSDRMHPLLIFLFPTYLKNALRKGVFKMYVHKEYNDQDVKGIINIDRHIRKNTPFIGNVAYSQREYVYNNYLIQLVRHTIEYIKRKPYGLSVISKCKDEIKIITDATPDYNAKDLRKIIIENKKNTVRHAYYFEYRRLQNLCLLILQNENPNIGFGTKKVFGILFDGAWLWEEYIAQLLGEDRFYHPMNKARLGVQYLFSVKKGPIYPDFIGVNSENRIIADAKYKPEDNISNKDYLQMLAYMYRFEAKRGCYLYPEIEGAEDTVLWLNGGVSYEENLSRRDDIFVVKHGLKIPGNSSSYEEFISEMLINERLFVYKLDMRFSADVIIRDE
jgi:5-methylcytosine-specific restriction endonuclease McrBC regulatory subunit McrC